MGCAGFEIELPDGTKEKLYINLEDLRPEASWKVQFVNSPIIHRGNRVYNTSWENCAILHES